MNQTDINHAAVLRRHVDNQPSFMHEHVRVALERAIYVLKHWEWMDGYHRDEASR